MTSNPNILFVTIDCLRADHVGCYGYGRPTTPTIDNLSREGNYAACIANAPGTRWAFKPLYMAAHALQIEHAGLPPSEGTTLVEALPDAYTAGCFAHNQFVSQLTNLDRGYDRFVGPEDHPDDERRDEITTDYAIDWIEDATEPWFCHVHMMDAHAEWERRDDLLRRIRGDTDVDHVRRAHEYVTPGKEPPQKVIDAYDVGIASADEQVGRLQSEAILSDRQSATVVTADHGEEFGTYHDYHWAHLGPTMTDVPLVTRGIELHRSTHQHLDIPALILEEAGADHIPNEWWLNEYEPYGGASFLSLEDQVGAYLRGNRYIRDTETGETFVLCDEEGTVGDDFETSASDYVDEMLRYCEDHQIGTGVDTSRDALPEDAKQRLRELGYLD